MRCAEQNPSQTPPSDLAHTVPAAGGDGPATQACAAAKNMNERDASQWSLAVLCTPLSIYRSMNVILFPHLA